MEYDMIRIITKEGELNLFASILNKTLKKHPTYRFHSVIYSDTYNYSDGYSDGESNSKYGMVYYCLFEIIGSE